MRSLSSVTPIFLLSILFHLTTQAFDPIVKTILPRAGQTGTKIPFKIYGQRLNKAEEIILYRPGITISTLENIDNTLVKGTLHIAADAPLGEHPLRLRTTEGVSYLRTFWVTSLPITHENKLLNRRGTLKRENNDTFEKPQHTSLNTTILGTVHKKDIDYYSFSGKKGQLITAEVFGMRLGRVYFDPYLSILDSKQREIAACDDSITTKRDPFISLTLPTDDNYTILIRESTYRGNPESNYLLHLSESPRPTSVHPPVGKLKEELTLTFKGPSQEFKQTVTLPAKSGPTSVFAKKQNQIAPSPNTLFVTQNPIFPEQEPNNTMPTGKHKSLSLPFTCHGIIQEPEDRDWFRFTAKKDQEIRIQVHARSLRSPLDSTIQIRQEKNKKVLQTNDDKNNRIPDSKIDFKAPADGDYFLFISDQLKRGGPDFTYLIEASPRSSEIKATLPYAKNNDSQKNRAIVIPRGNHLAIVPNVTRQYTNCDVILQHDKLPPGVSLQSQPASRNPANFPILFSASKDAPLSSTLTRFTIKDPKSQLQGPFEENIHHIEINNAGSFCTTRNERLTVAVIDEAPFQLTMIAPPVPLVRNGTMTLKVKATRKDGFTAPIKVKIPWLPAGIGSLPEVTIPEGATEALFPINANEQTPLRTSQLCVTGEADTGNGNVRLSSPFVSLQVIEPYLNGSIDLATTTQGQSLTLHCELENLKPFSGEAELTLHGLPHKVTASPIKFTANDQTLQIPLSVPADARPGKNKNIFAQVKIKEGKHFILHQIAQSTTLIITPIKK